MKIFKAPEKVILPAPTSPFPISSAAFFQELDLHVSLAHVEAHTIFELLSRVEISLLCRVCLCLHKNSTNRNLGPFLSEDTVHACGNPFVLKHREDGKIFRSRAPSYLGSLKNFHHCGKP